MKLPIRIRVALYVTFTFAVLIVSLGFALTELYEKYTNRSFDVTLQAAASSVANRLIKENIKGDVSDINEDIGETVSNFENKVGVIRVGIFDASWREVLSRNDNDSVVIKVKQGEGVDRKGGKEFATISVRDNKYRCAFANFEFADSSQGTVVALGSLSSSRESIDRIRAIIFIIAPFTILLVGIGSLLIARESLRPLEKIASGIDGIEVDKPLVKLEVPQTGDEIKKVADSFNALIQKIGSLIDTQRNFLLDASHELKTPLTVIQTEIEMLLMKPGLPSGERENLQQLLSEVEYASKLAIDLIYLSKLESYTIAEMLPVDLGTMLEEVVSHFSRIARKKDIQLRVKHVPDLNVKADRDLLKRGLSNMIDNAIKYSRVGGEIWVTGKLDEKSANAVVIIEDRGVGINKDELPRIFDRFYRTKSSRSGDEKGSGLGLSIAKRIIEQHNGKIVIESEPNVGTVVKIEFPAKV